MTYKTNIFRKWYFWTILAFISANSWYFNWVYFKKFYPILNVKISIDKNQIEQLSQELCKKYNLGPQEYSQSTHFISDKNIEHYIEQNFSNFSGTKELVRFLDNKLLQIYTWQVRHFTEGNPNECLLKFTPEGKPYGFIEQISEIEPGPALTQENAFNVAKDFALKEWDLDLEDYILIESSHQDRSNGRKDYTFIFDKKMNPTSNFELKNSSNKNEYQFLDLINAIKHKLIISVYGNKVTVLDQFIELPHLPSISPKGMQYELYLIFKNLSSVLLLLGYLLSFIICLIGLLILIKKNYLLSNAAVLLGILLALSQLIYQLNSISDIWLNYNISQSYFAHLINNILGYAIGFLLNSALYTMVIMIAEGLTRLAFTSQPQFWKSLNKHVITSFTLIGIIISSYLLFGIYLALTNGSYILDSQLFQCLNINLNRVNVSTLGHFSPTLSVLMKSFYESFWNQLFFTAIPIALFTIIGDKIGIRKIGIFFGFIFQILVFALINISNLELGCEFLAQLISLLFFGLLYINFGLVPGIIIQWLSNVIIMSLPIFGAVGYFWNIQKIVIISIIFLPIIYLIINLIRSGKISELQEKYLNASWTSQANNYIEKQEDQIPNFESSKSKIISLIILTILSFGLIYQTTNFNKYEPKFEITRDQAIEKAKEFIESKDLSLDGNWETLSRIIIPNKFIAKYIWQHFGEKIYDKVNGTYIKFPLFEIKFIKFDHVHYQRIEEYTIRLNTSGKIESFKHILPEDAAGISLSENDANHLAIAVITEQFKLNPDTLRILSSFEIKRPLRKDWIITIQDSSIDYIGDGQAHIIVKICGDEITSINRKIYAPKGWLTYRSKQDQFTIIFGLLKELIFFLIILIAFFQLLQTAKSRWAIVSSLIIWLSYLSLIIANILLNIPELTANLNPGKSFYFQIIYTESITIATEIFKSLIILIFAMNIFNKKIPIQKDLKSLGIINLGLGVIATGLSAALFFLYKNLPIAYSLQSLNTYLPAVSFVITNLILYISQTLTVLFIAQYAKFDFSLKTIFSALAITLLIVSELEIRNLNVHVLVFAIIFVIILLSHLVIIRYNTGLIPVILAMIQIARLGQEFIADPFVGSQNMVLIAIGGIMLVMLVVNLVINKSEKNMNLKKV